jgi:hypothetical protein
VLHLCYCVTFVLLCYICVTVLHFCYCVTFVLLCYICVAVLHLWYCVTFVLLCYICVTVLHLCYCVTLSQIKNQLMNVQLFSPSKCPFATHIQTVHLTCKLS